MQPTSLEALERILPGAVDDEDLEPRDGPVLQDRLEDVLLLLLLLLLGRLGLQVVEVARPLGGRPRVQVAAQLVADALDVELLEDAPPGARHHELQVLVGGGGLARARARRADHPAAELSSDGVWVVARMPGWFLRFRAV